MPLAAFVHHGFDELRETILKEGFRDAAARGYYASLRLADPSTFHLHSRELVEMSCREDLARRMAALEVPVVYIAGSPGGACRRSLELLEAADVEVVAISPSGHWPFIDRPAGFSREMVRILEP
jgi:pimeloyl-ACP methyl ester carboxylesterase